MRCLGSRGPASEAASAEKGGVGTRPGRMRRVGREACLALHYFGLQCMVVHDGQKCTWPGWMWSHMCCCTPCIAQPLMKSAGGAVQ